MEDQLIPIYKTDTLKDLSRDIIEMAFDSNITNVVLKQFPIVKGIKGVLEVFGSIQDRLYLKKYLMALYEIREYSPEERALLLLKLEDQDTRGFEKLLNAVNRLENNTKAKAFGRLMGLAIEEKINIEEFEQLNHLLQSNRIKDLKQVRSIGDWPSDRNSYLVSQGLGKEELKVPAPMMGNKPKKLEYKFVRTVLGELLNRFWYPIFDPEEDPYETTFT